MTYLKIKNLLIIFLSVQTVLFFCVFSTIAVNDLSKQLKGRIFYK
jgi:hypothetical protein